MRVRLRHQPACKSHELTGRWSDSVMGFRVELISSTSGTVWWTGTESLIALDDEAREVLAVADAAERLSRAKL